MVAAEKEAGVKGVATEAVKAEVAKGAVAEVVRAVVVKVEARVGEVMEVDLVGSMGVQVETSELEPAPSAAVDRTLDSNFFHPERPFALVFEPPPPSLTLTKTSCLKVRARNPPPIGLSRRLTILIVFTDRYFIRSEIASTRARDRARVSRHDVRRFRFRPLRRVRRETLREVSRESSRSRRSRAIDDDSRRNLRKERC